MKTCLKALALATLIGSSAPVLAQDDSSDQDALRMAAIEALISAPPERALPLARKVVEGDYSDELKERALFVLSQIDEPEAQNLILGVARSGTGALREEAIRMIGIGGNREALAQLHQFFVEGDAKTREAVLEAYLIADDEDAVYRIAVETQDEVAFEQAVETLGAMGAHEKLRQLRNQAALSGSGVNEALIEAYAISGDFESLHAMATDAGDPEQQLKAIEGLGIVGSGKADAALVEIYRASDNEDVREAAIEGLMISGNDELMLELYRESDDAEEKRRLLEYLVATGSDAVWEIIDQALDGGS